MATGMSAEAFRKDKYLRASGYNFYVWAVVNLLVTWPLYAALGGHPWPPLLALFFPIALIASGFFLAVLNDNRVAKMYGEASAIPTVEAAHIWGPIFLIGISLTIVLGTRGPIAYVQPVWLLLIGAAYLTWGNFGVAEFRWLGWVLIAAGTYAGLAVHPIESEWHLASRQALFVWVVWMGIAWFPFGAYVNWKYLRAIPPRVPPA